MYAHVWQIKLLEFSIFENKPPKTPKKQNKKNPIPPKTKQKTPPKTKTKLSKAKRTLTPRLKVSEGKSKVCIGGLCQGTSSTLTLNRFCEPLICSKSTLQLSILQHSFACLSKTKDVWILNRYSEDRTWGGCWRTNKTQSFWPSQKILSVFCSEKFRFFLKKNLLSED